MTSSDPSFLSLFSNWDWTDATGIFLVFFGVLGTVVLLFRKFRKFEHDPLNLMPEEYFKKNWESDKSRFEQRKEHQEIVFELVLVVGLAFELVAFPNHIKEAARLHREAAVAGQKAQQANEHIVLIALTNTQLSLQLALVESNNLVLREKVVELESSVLALRSQLAETRKQVIENDPANQPITFASAFASLNIHDIETNLTFIGDRPMILEMGTFKPDKPDNEHQTFRIVLEGTASSQRMKGGLLSFNVFFAESHVRSAGGEVVTPSNFDMVKIMDSKFHESPKIEVVSGMISCEVNGLRVFFFVRPQTNRSFSVSSIKVKDDKFIILKDDLWR